MLIHEQFYTSAPELLDVTSSNLGVIAQTQGFPKDLDADLDAHRSYTLRNEDLRDAASCPPRFSIAVCGRQKSHLVISRVSFAGADHTGRTKPFAHHLATRCDEMAAAGVTPSMLARYATRTLRHKWEGPPTWLEPRRWDESTSVESEQLSPTWEKLLPPDQIFRLLANVTDALVADPASRSPVVVCIPPAAAHAVLEMCADVVTLLPASVQAGCVCVSHVVEMADYLRDSALIFTYPDTPFVKQCLQRQDVRRPLIFDLTDRAALPSHPTGPYAEALMSDTSAPSFDRMRSLAQLWDTCGFAPVHKSIFPPAVRLRDRMATRPAVRELPGIAAEMAAFPNAPFLRSHLDGWCNTYLQGLLDLPDAQRWAAVSEFACDDRWPASTRSVAFDELARHADSSLSFALGDGAAIDGAFETASRELGRRAASLPAVASVAVRLAATQPSERRLRFAASAMSHAKPTFAAALQWWDEIASGGEEVQQQLSAALTPQLTRTSRSGEDIGAMRERTRIEHPHARFNCNVYCEVLRSHFAASSSDKVRRQLAEWLMDVAFQDTSADGAAKELRNLLEVHKSAVTPQQVEAWLQRARGTSQEATLQRVATEAGLQSVTEPPVAAPQRQHEPVVRHPPPPPAPPVFGEDRLRTKPMRVGRARGVLPRGVIHALLFLLLAGTVTLYVRDGLRSGRWWTGHSVYFAILAGLGLTSWITSVMTDVSVRSRPDRLGIAFGVRKIVAVVLIALLSVLLWPFIMWGWHWITSAFHGRRP